VTIALRSTVPALHAALRCRVRLRTRPPAAQQRRLFNADGAIGRRPWIDHFAETRIDAGSETGGRHGNVVAASRRW
jgi:hypothetical protein